MMHAHNVNLGRVAAKGATANMAETSDRDVGIFLHHLFAFGVSLLLSRFHHSR